MNAIFVMYMNIVIDMSVRIINEFVDSFVIGDEYSDWPQTAGL